MDMFSVKNLARKIFLMAISAKNLVQIPLALRRMIFFHFFYNMAGCNSFAYLQHVIHKNIINVKEKVLDNIFYIIIKILTQLQWFEYIHVIIVLI